MKRKKIKIEVAKHWQVTTERFFSHSIRSFHFKLFIVLQAAAAAAAALGSNSAFGEDTISSSHIFIWISILRT